MVVSELRRPVRSSLGEITMDESKAIEAPQRGTNFVGPYTVYSAGGLFTQDELATNILIKEAVWRLSNGKFQLILPQSKELQVLDRPDVEAYIRNDDLLQVVRADILFVRFDGSELDSGTVIEFAMAKHLGKPTVILRTDFRRQSSTGLSEPYNLMVKNWPRSVDIHLNSYVVWARLFAEECQALDDNEPFQATMKAELGTAQKSIDEIAAQVIDGMETVLKMKSPYPPEYQEVVYRAARFSPGSGFEELLTASEVDEIIQRLRKNGTL
jgi:nucleoside 2-deoxyribosyltransferase